MTEIIISDRILHDTRITDFFDKNKVYSVKSVPADYHEPITPENFDFYLSGNPVVEDGNCKNFQFEEPIARDGKQVGILAFQDSKNEDRLVVFNAEGKLFFDDKKMFYIGPKSDEYNKLDGGVDHADIWEIKCN
jgi:hypothetical protein